MIATILPGSAGFHAVKYNENKVAKGCARLLEMKNFGDVGIYEPYTTAELTQFLLDWSSRNNRVTKPQIHIAISCRGHEMTEWELLDFAHEYLKEMGYGEESQPLLVYSHYDNENTHLHLITSRVGPDGKKIDNNHERRRSQAAIDKILKLDRHGKIDRDIEAIKSYSFSTMGQIKAVFKSLGYEFYIKDETAYIKFGGSVRKTMPVSELTALFKLNTPSKERTKQLRTILIKYRDASADREQLTKELQSKLGLDLVFFGKKDAPYGYMVVDHANKTVINGMRILSTERLLDFTTPEEKFECIENFIDDLLTNNPTMDVWELNDKLRRSHAYIKKDTVYFRNLSHKLPEFMANAIRRNNRIKWIESFKPTTEAERDLLCRLSKVTQPELITLTADRDEQYQDNVNTLRQKFGNPETQNIRAALAGIGYRLHRNDGNTYAISFSGKRIINLTDEGFDLSKLMWRSERRKKQQGHTIQPKRQQTARGHQIKPLRDVGGGSQGGKREWEVGHRGNYDEIDDERSLKW